MDKNGCCSRCWEDARKKSQYPFRPCDLRRKDEGSSEESAPQQQRRGDNHGEPQIIDASLALEQWGRLKTAPLCQTEPQIGERMALSGMSVNPHSNRLVLIQHARSVGDSAMDLG